MVAAIAVIERKALPPEIELRVIQAVQQYLDTLPHAREVWRNYDRFRAMDPMDVRSSDIEAAYRWTLIERRAEEVAQREIEEAFPGQAVRFEFTLEGPVFPPQGLGARIWVN